MPRRYGYGQFSLCEDATQEALLAAAVQWPADGQPGNPRGWLVTVAPRKLLDQVRSEQSRRQREERTVVAAPQSELLAAAADADALPSTDDSLILLFGCCHPAIAAPSQIALTLRAIAACSRRRSPRRSECPRPRWRSGSAAPSRLCTYQLQTAIAAVYDEAKTMDDTDWPQILGLYDLLEVAVPSPFTALNRAVAVGLVHGPRAGLDLLDTLQQDKRTAKYHRLFAARAHLLGLAGEPDEAAKSYAQAAELSSSTPERRYLTTQAKRLSSGVEGLCLDPTYGRTELSLLSKLTALS